MIPHRIQAQLSILGGFIIFLILGSIYIWGSMLVYATSYFRQHHNDTISPSTVNLVFPIMQTASAIFLPIGLALSNKYGYRLICMIGIFIVFSSVFIASYCTYFILFTLFYGFFYGVGFGIAYLIPIQNALQYYPKNKGTASGLIFMGIGFGAIIFNWMLFLLVNPDNIQPIIVDDKTGEQFYDAQVTSNLPFGLRVLAILYLIIGGFGSLLIFQYKEERGANLTQYEENLGNNSQQIYPGGECPNVITGLKHSLIYKILIIIICSCSFCFLINSNYKYYGIEHIQSDSYYALVASASSFANAVARIFWGFLMDSISFKKIIIVNLLIQLLLDFLVRFLVKVKVLYLICIFMAFFCYGAYPSMMPAIHANTYGVVTGTKLYTFSHLGYSLSGWLQYFIVYYFLSWEQIFNIYLGIISFAILLVIFTDFNLNWKEIVSKSTKNMSVKSSRLIDNNQDISTSEEENLSKSELNSQTNLKQSFIKNDNL